MKLPITQAKAKAESVTEKRAVAATVDKYEKVLLLSDERLLRVYKTYRFFGELYCPMCYRYDINDNCFSCPIYDVRSSVCCSEFASAMDYLSDARVGKARIEFQNLINRLKGL